MKLSELKNKSVPELKKELLELLRELFNLRIHKVSGQQSNKTHLFKKTRVGIARIKTILKEKGSIT